MTKKSLFMITLFITLAMGGCGVINIFRQSNESVRDEILQHLYQKYGVAFTAISLERGHHDFLVAYPAGGNPDIDIVGVQRHVRDGNIEFRDTFFGIIIREDLETSVADALSDLSLPVQVVFPSSTIVFDNQFDRTKNLSDFNDWVHNGNPMHLFVSIVIEFENKEYVEIIANQAFDKLKDLGYMLDINLHLVPASILCR